MVRKKGEGILRAARFTAFIAVGLIFLAALIDALLFFGVTAGSPPDPLFFEFEYRGLHPVAEPRIAAHESLREPFLRELWAWNRDAFPSLLASDFLLALGLFLFSYTAWALSKAYRATGGMAPKVMFLCFVAGAVIPAVGFLQNLGSNTAGDRISSAYEEDGSPAHVIVSLQIAYLMSTGRAVWLQAMIYVFLSTGFFFAGFLGLVSGGLSRSFKLHAGFSFLVGVLGFAVFAVDIAKFFFPETSSAYAFLTIIYMVLMVPAWTLWLGFIITQIPAEFMKGSVVVKGPEYTELGEDNDWEGDVEMNATEASLENSTEANDADRNANDEGVVDVSL